MFLFFGVSYLLASVEEWLFHKYMHLKMTNPDSIQKTHMLHHTNTNKTTLEVSVPFSDDICFDIRNVNDCLQLLYFSVGNCSLLSFLFPTVSATVVFTTTSSLLAFNVLVWNTYHAYIHGLDAYTICFIKGIPRKYVPIENIYADWVIQNHRTHHRFPSGNYNIVFPGADYLFFTYRSP